MGHGARRVHRLLNGGMIGPMGLRLATVTILALGILFAALLKWPDQSVEGREHAMSGVTDFAPDSTGPLPVLKSTTPSVPSIGESDHHLPFAALLLLGLGTAVVSILWSARHRARHRSARDNERGRTIGPWSDVGPGSLQPPLPAFTRPLDEHEQRLTRTRAATSQAAPRPPAGTHTRAPPAQPNEADAAQAPFLSHLSHELRTPLHGILGHVQALRRDGQAHPTHDRGLEAIERSGRHLLGVVNDLIDLARLESDQLTLMMHPLDLQRLIDELRATLQSVADSRGLRLVIETSPTRLPWVLSDGPRLRQLLTRLASSAIDGASGSGTSAALKIMIRLSEPGLAMTLTGQHRRTERTESIATPPHDLGYVVGQRLISRFGGEIRHDLASGALSARVPCDIIERPATSPLEYQGRLPTGRHCRLLVIEPQDAALKVCARVLAGPQCTIEGESDVEQARRRLQQDAFDLVLLDIGSTSRSAQVDARELRLLAAGEPKLVALCAGGLSETLRDDGYGAFDRCLTKPLDPAQLVETIRALLEPPNPDWTEATPPRQITQPWPQPLGREFAAKIQTAVEHGDVDDLFSLVDGLAERTDAPRPDVEALRLAAHLFDFEALLRLANHLSQGSIDRTADA